MLTSFTSILFCAGYQSLSCKLQAKYLLSTHFCFQTRFLYLIWIIRRTVYPFLLNFFTSTILFCAGYQNLSYKFARFIFTVYFEASNSFLFLSTILFLLSQPIQPTFFHASNTHFLNPTLPFANNFFQPIFSTTSFFLLSTMCLSNSTINSAKPFFFLQTIFLSQQPFQPSSYIFNHSTTFSCFPPPCNFFCGKTFHFLCFHCKVLGGAL